MVKIVFGLGRTKLTPRTCPVLMPTLKRVHHLSIISLLRVTQAQPLRSWGMQVTQAAKYISTRYPTSSLPSPLLLSPRLLLNGRNKEKTHKEIQPSHCQGLLVNRSSAKRLTCMVPLWARSHPTVSLSFRAPIRHLLINPSAA